MIASDVLFVHLVLRAAVTATAAMTDGMTAETTGGMTGTDGIVMTAVATKTI